MERVTQQFLFILLLVAGVCYGQSIADVARESRKQQGNNGAPKNVISTDDVVPVTPTMIPSVATLCAHENHTCNFSGTQTIAYGANGHYNFKSGVTGSIECKNEIFGDPIFGTFKDCYIVPASVMASLEGSRRSVDSVAQLLPGSKFTGEGTLVAPGRGKHSYRIVNLDATRFVNGGTLHITVTVGDGASNGSFDLYPQGAQVPAEGSPNSLANVWNVARASSRNITYHFDHGTVFQFRAEGDWNSEAGTTNTYSFIVDVQSQ